MASCHPLKDGSLVGGWGQKVLVVSEVLGDARPEWPSVLSPDEGWHDLGAGHGAKGFAAFCPSLNKVLHVAFDLVH